MGQAFDRDGNVLGEAYGDTKREVFDKLNQEFKDAHEIRIKTLTDMRQGAQEAFRLGVEAMISEIRRFAVSAEGAIGEISIDEAFQGVRRVVVDRVARLTGEAQGVTK